MCRCPHSLSSVAIVSVRPSVSLHEVWSNSLGLIAPVSRAYRRILTKWLISTSVAWAYQHSDHASAAARGTWRIGVVRRSRSPPTGRSAKTTFAIRACNGHTRMFRKRNSSPRMLAAAVQPSQAARGLLFEPLSLVRLRRRSALSS